MRTSFLTTGLIALASFFNILSAQQINTYVNTDSLEAGAVFNYIIVVEGQYDTLEYPGENDFGEHIEVISRQRFQAGANRDSLVYELQFFGVEDVVIDRKAILLHQGDADTTLFTNRVPLAFKSSLEEGDEEFRPLKPIFDFAVNYWPYILGILLLALAAWYLYRRYSNAEPKPKPVAAARPQPFVNPLFQLKKKLSELQITEKLKEEEDFETFYVELGNAIRLYLKRVYQIPALEMTTREIIQALQKEMASSKIISITRKMLNEADIVKFANFRPGQEQAENALKTADEFAKTVSVIDSERIEYLRYQYDEEHGLLEDTPSEKSGEEV
ncbi:MAG: hypothetical protein WD604_14235 [Balneolaceae bacterium]